MLADLLADLRQAARAFAARPGFSIAAIATIALAIGANTVVFGVVNGILLRPVPYADAGSLVSVWPDHFLSHREVAWVEEHAESFTGVAAISPGWDMALTNTDRPTQLRGARLTANAFSVLGRQAAIGRTFVPAEATPGNDAVVVLSHDAWRVHFGADSAVVGRQVTLDGAAHTVVGVMPRDFELHRPQTEVWRVLAFDTGQWYYQSGSLLAIARLAPGVTVSQAQSEFRALTAGMREEFGFDDGYGADASVSGMHEWIAGSVQPTLLVLTGAVGFVLLLAAANLANLLLTRAIGRRRELAVRAAIGATTGRLTRQLLAESALLTGIGGVAGIGLAAWGVSVVTRVLPADTPRLAAVGVDLTVLVAAVIVTITTGLLVGIVPALTIARSDPQRALRLAQGDASGRLGRRTRGALVIAEVALGVVLLAGAGLMLQTLWRLHRVDPGFRPDGVLTMSLQPTGRSDEGLRQYFAGVFERVEAIPGVRSAGGIQHVPLSGSGWSTRIEIEGVVVEAGASQPAVGWRIIARDYLETIAQPLRAGRAFTPADAMDAEPVVLVNEAMARRFWPGEAPIGKRVRAQQATGGVWARVVGVVADVRHIALDREPVAELYRPLAQHPLAGMKLLVRVSGDPYALAPAVSAAIWEGDRDVPIGSIRSLDDLASASVARPRLVLLLLGTFAMVGLVVGGVGVYGIVAYQVTARTREIGIRVALGARPQALVGNVVGEGLRFAAIGLVIGLAVALLLSRVLGDLVFGVGTRDPITFSTVALVLIAVTGIAGWLPARRAARVDPIVALRAD